MLFDKILNTWRRERVEEELVPLEPNFYEKVQTYLKHLEVMATADEDELARKIFNKRFQRVNFLVNDLIKMRMEKHFHETMASKPPPTKLPAEEERFREKLSHLIHVHQDSMLGISTIQEEDEESLEDHYEFGLVVENEANQVVGPDLLTYGPFEKGDIVLFPNDMLRQFVLRGKMRRIDLH